MDLSEVSPLYTAPGQATVWSPVPQPAVSSEGTLLPEAASGPASPGTPWNRPGRAAHTFNPTVWERGRKELCGFEASLAYTESQESQGHMERPCLKKHKPTLIWQASAL